MLRVGLGGLSAIGLGATMPALVSRFAHAGAMPGTRISDDNILVVVQLSGGNDGLNTIVPIGDDAYHAARPLLALREGLHRLDDRFALNPGLSAFKRLFDDGKLAIINGCGYPKPSRSHFRALEVWHTASTDFRTTGWLGQYVDRIIGGGGCSLNAVNVGPELPQALVADRARVPSIQSIDDLPLRDALADASPAVDFLARQATDAIIDFGPLDTIANRYRSDANYPGGLGSHLQLIAKLIATNLGTKLFYCQAGGFDTHANQLAQHERLLTNVADSIAAFEKDLSAKGLSNKVTVMCFSEFGRRVAENNSGGTDHGAAGPMFIVGARRNGGIYGEHPSLTCLADGDLQYTTDFRRVYDTLLRQWLNGDAATVLGSTFKPLSFL